MAGVYFGRDTVRWNWEKIVNDRGGFAEEFSDVCSKKESIYMKVMLISHLIMLEMKEQLCARLLNVFLRNWL